MRSNRTRFLVPEVMILIIIAVITLGILVSVQGPAFALTYLIIGLGLVSLVMGGAVYVRSRTST